MVRTEQAVLSMGSRTLKARSWLRVSASGAAPELGCDPHVFPRMAEEGHPPDPDLAAGFQSFTLSL
jgi:hypothetical protein